ncbi:zinc finger, C2H2-type transcription factor [Rhodotorula toruloides]|uniref:Zinc finger, C2H2-type transcription factor n=1 Tax=Rhodotorula toruloides TaxID=5286 RepID=A0A511KKV2_RHOTO|nr:zinc finger, C2H2-type transcription factor [Rhodotorula toruloides]
MPAARGSASGQTFPCPDCDKTFSRKEYMARHYRSKHSKERPFQCEFCEHAFSRSDLLRRHYKTRSSAASGSASSAVLAAPPEVPGATYEMPFASSSASAALPAPAQNNPLLPTPPPSYYAHMSMSMRDHPIYGLPPAANMNSSFSIASGSGTAPLPDNGPSPFSTFSNSSNLTFSCNSPQTPFAADASLPPAPPYPLHGMMQPPPPIPSTSSTILSAPSAVPSTSSHPHSSPTTPTTPSTSAFKSGSLSHDTLAPGLSRTGSFTRDEVLASEVLRDLMRSPLGMSGNTPPVSTAMAGGMAWHSATSGKGQTEAAQGRGEGAGTGEEGGAVAGADAHDWALSSVFGTTASGAGNSVLVSAPYAGPAVTPHNKLEETPAAQALAEYFNKGGVGGITALDLGFPTEPCLFPDWMFKAPTVHEDEKRFWMPEQKFCLGYLYPWHVPPLPVLSSYAKKATERLLPAMPIVHAPSVVLNEMEVHTAFALTVAGGAYERDGQSFSNEMLVEKRVFLVRGFQEKSKTWDQKFASLQSMLLYQLLGLFHRDEQQRLLSHSFHSALIYMLRALDLPTRVRETTASPPREEMQGEELEKAWRNWVKVETWRRVAFIVFLADLEHAAATKTNQLLSLSDLDIDLPAAERAWSAKTAEEWRRHHIMFALAPTEPFISVIRALLNHKNDDPFSESALLIADLGRLSSFPFLILSRTLSYLEKKTEEALEQVDPFKSFLGGIGVVEDREAENRDLLQRIRSGREILRRLPGGMARGGGEGWFNEIIPSAKDFAYDDSPPTTSSRSSASSGGPVTPPLPNQQPAPASDVADIFAEFDPQPYKPFYGHGGATTIETFEQAQTRLKNHATKRVADVRQLWPELMGLIAVYSLYGFLQEKIMKSTTYGPDKQHFTSSSLLIFLNRLFSIAVGLAIRFWKTRQEPKGSTFSQRLRPASPYYAYASVAASNFASTTCQYQALRYVSYTTQSLAKTSKMIPVLVVGACIYRKTYRPREWVAASVILAGCATYLFSTPPSSRAHDIPTATADRSTALVGAIYLLGYVFFDGLVSSTQEAVFGKNPSSTDPFGPQSPVLDQMIWTNVFAALIAIAASIASTATGSLWPDLELLLTSARLLWDICIFSAASAVGLIILLNTIASFGALTSSLVMTIRQFLSILINAAAFNNFSSVSLVGWIGVLWVASGIWIKVNKRGDGRVDGSAISEDEGADAEELQDMMEKESKWPSVSSIPGVPPPSHNQVKQIVMQYLVPLAIPVLGALLLTPILSFSKRPTVTIEGSRWDSQVHQAVSPACDTELVTVPYQPTSRTALASFPRSGNSYLRSLVERATGFQTSSVYCDPELERTFHGECNHTLNFFVKTHFPALPTVISPNDSSHADYYKQFDSAIHLVRNPLDAISSWYHFLHTSRTSEGVYNHTAKVELPGGKFGVEQRKEILEYAKRWRRHTTYWQHAPISTRVLRYEDLTARLIPNMMSLLAFLLPDDNLPLLEHVICVVEHHENLQAYKSRRAAAFAQWDKYDPSLRHAILEIVRRPFCRLGYRRVLLKAKGDLPEVQKAMDGFCDLSMVNTDYNETRESWGVGE